MEPFATQRMLDCHESVDEILSRRRTGVREDACSMMHDCKAMYYNCSLINDTWDYGYIYICSMIRQLSHHKSLRMD